LFSASREAAITRLAGEETHSIIPVMIPRKLQVRFIGCLVLACLVLAFESGHCAGISAAYFEAESCAQDVRRSSVKAKARSNWTRCIDKFQAVYRRDSRGPWAPASLYHSGSLYLDLARSFGSESDRKAATEQFELLQRQFPKSGYRDRAAAELQKLQSPATLTNEPQVKEISRGTPIPTEPARPSIGKTADRKARATADSQSAVQDPLAKAEACFRSLHGNRPTESTRREWMLCIGRFHNAYLQDPTGPLAAQALFQEGLLYLELHHGLKFNSDLRAARENFEKIEIEFADSPYAAKAAKELQAIARSRPAPQPVAQRPAAPAPPAPESIPTEPAGAVPAVETAKPPADAEGLALVQDLQHWSNPNYTRVVIYVDRETGYSHRLLKKDPANDKPPRLYVDLSNATLSGGKQRSIPINDDLLSDARAARYTLDSVRVVVDIKSFETYKVFSLQDPFRIVLDIWGKNGAAGPAQDAPREPEPPAAGSALDRSRKVPRGALAKQLALGVRRIVIDPGHGGKDFGAPGFTPGVHEKDVVLEIAKRVARRVRDELNLEAILTRSDDRYLTLEERTAFANTRGADLFVSIHTNASRDPRAYGTETYFLNLATDDEAIRVAAMENATSTKNISDLHSILNDLLRNAKINESSRLAQVVQSSLIKNLNRRGYDRVKDKGVKQAPFYVLLGARMPSILVETAFISNRDECHLLTSPSYQEHLAESIVRGLRTYIGEINPTAFEGPVARPSG
jgi:N-acetylmuramoyl-L-alanine amidase